MWTLMKVKVKVNSGGWLMPRQESSRPGTEYSTPLVPLTDKKRAHRECHKTKQMICLEIPEVGSMSWYGGGTSAIILPKLSLFSSFNSSSLRLHIGDQITRHNRTTLVITWIATSRVWTIRNDYLQVTDWTNRDPQKCWKPNKHFRGYHTDTHYYKTNQALHPATIVSC